MNAIIGLLLLILFITLASCSNDKPAVVKKEIIVVPAPVVKEVPEKSTTVIVDKNGVKVETKKVDVTINSEKKKQ